MSLPMLFRHLRRHTRIVHIDPIQKPPLPFSNLNLIPTHLPLCHSTVAGESPVFESVAPLPFHAVGRVLEFVPEVDGRGSAD
jgi:hypothetical protein